MLFIGKKYKKKAEELMGLSRLVAISSMTTFMDKFPALNNLIKNAQNTNDWDFYMTVAGIQTTFVSMALSIDPREAQKYAVRIQESMNSWDKMGSRAMSDLNQFIQKNTQSGVDYDVALGLWVIWNLKGAQPSQAEMDVAPAIGNYLIASAKNWWK